MLRPERILQIWITSSGSTADDSLRALKQLPEAVSSLMAKIRQGAVFRFQVGGIGNWRVHGCHTTESCCCVVHRNFMRLRCIRYRSHRRFLVISGSGEPLHKERIRLHPRSYHVFTAAKGSRHDVVHHHNRFSAQARLRVRHAKDNEYRCSAAPW